jgi:uncharacterized protein (TIGR03435 family)
VIVQKQEQRDPWKMPLKIHLLAMVILVPALRGEYSHAQVPAPARQSNVAPRDANSHGSSDVKELKFEVVSIKPTGSGVGTDEKYLPDGFIRTNIPLSRLILMAYFPQVLWTPERLRNVPDWVGSDHYDLVAKVSPEDVAEWQKHSASMLDNQTLQSALQAVLRDRCKLMAHRIPAEVAGYDLLIAKRGPGPKLTKPDEVFPSDIHFFSDGWGSGVILDMANNSAKLAYYNATMDQFVASFSFVARFPIQNRTGLTGKYDIVLNDALPVQGAEPELYASMKPSERYDLSSAGLRLQQTMVSTTTLVIDHIERPSPN